MMVMGLIGTVIKYATYYFFNDYIIIKHIIILILAIVLGLLVIIKCYKPAKFED